jgi:hypothetical protein
LYIPPPRDRLPEGIDRNRSAPEAAELTTARRTSILL